MRLDVLVKFFSIHIAIFKTVLESEFVNYWNLEIGIEITFHELDL